MRIRTRLTAWYLAIFSLVMLLYVCGACVVQYWQLTDQLFHEEVEDMETVEGLLYFTPSGQLELNESYHSRPENKLIIDRLMEVRGSDGAVLFRNPQLKGAALGGLPRPGEFTDGHTSWTLRLEDGRHVLGVSHRHPVEGKMLFLRVAYSTDPLRRRVVTLFGLLMLVLPLALIPAGIAGYHFAGKILNPLKAMARRTEQITARRLSSRIPVENPDDELGHMARVLNGLLQRLEESFAQLQRFTSDVSHELRTPLTSIRSVGEVGLQRSHSHEEYRDIIGSMLEEVARLTSMIDTLLTIAHADSGAIRLDRTVFPIMDLVDESVNVVGVLAEDKGQSLVVKGDRGISVHADRGFLRMAVINLLDNAVKYSPAGGTIRVVVEARTMASPRDAVYLAIQDEGPGIPAGVAERVFDRFYRLDEGRARDAGGAGLGLAIAKWSVEAHGGEIKLESTPGLGSTFSVQLPVTAETASAG
ncbi:HAMP domain-containing protein [Acidobacteria bacterium AB60]|nr:HAMP domain-containing protein [Acidobacteria bacterium AB60]